MTDLLLVIFSAALVNNIVVLEVIGADPALAFLRRQDVAFDLSLTLLVLLPVVIVASWLLQHWLMSPLDLEYLQLLLLVAVILCSVYGLKALVPFLPHSLSTRLDPLLPFAGLNVTVLGTVLLNQEAGNGFPASIAFAIGTALGFALLLLLMTAVRERLEAADVPLPFRGMPVLLLTLSIMAMAFMGFKGLIVL